MQMSGLNVRLGGGGIISFKFLTGRQPISLHESFISKFLVPELNTNKPPEMEKSVSFRRSDLVVKRGA